MDYNNFQTDHFFAVMLLTAELDFMSYYFLYVVASLLGFL